MFKCNWMHDVDTDGSPGSFAVTLSDRLLCKRTGGNDGSETFQRRPLEGDWQKYGPCKDSERLDGRIQRA